MKGTQLKTAQKDRRHRRISLRIKQEAKGGARLSVYRSTRSIYAQIIDDSTGRTLCAVGNQGDKKRKGNVAEAGALGEKMAKAAGAKKIERVVFDRGGNKYHGRIKSFAEGARKGGLKF